MIRELILNKPPIRTANNFEMNNVVIKEDMPYEIGRFKNIEIENKENSKIIITKFIIKKVCIIKGFYTKSRILISF